MRSAPPAASGVALPSRRLALTPDGLAHSVQMGERLAVGLENPGFVVGHADLRAVRAYDDLGPP